MTVSVKDGMKISVRNPPSEKRPHAVSVGRIAVRISYCARKTWKILNTGVFILLPCADLLHDRTDILLTRLSSGGNYGNNRALISCRVVPSSPRNKNSIEHQASMPTIQAFGATCVPDQHDHPYADWRIKGPTAQSTFVARCSRGGKSTSCLLLGEILKSHIVSLKVFGFKLQAHAPHLPGACVAGSLASCPSGMSLKVEKSRGAPRRKGAYSGRAVLDGRHPNSSRKQMRPLDRLRASFRNWNSRIMP